MERLLIFGFAIPLLLCSAIRCAAQGEIRPSYGYESWDTATGFPGGKVYSITQTADGYLWIGTSKGLLRYDGLMFVPVPGDSNTRFPILGLVTDPSDQLWAADDHTHLFRYDAGRLAGPLSDDGKRLSRNAPISRSRDGWLLFVSELRGLIKYERGTPRVLLEPSSVPYKPTSVAQTADGTYWIGSLETGLFRLNLNGNGKQIEQVAALKNVKINCLLPVGDSSLLIGTDQGLLRLHGGDLIQRVSPELDNLAIFAIAHGRNDEVWVGTDGQVFKASTKDIDKDGRIHSLDRLSLRSMVTALFEDRDANLWIGGPEKIERYRDSGFATYLSSAGLPSNNCGAIYVDPQQRVWFAPWGGGLFRLSQGKLERIKVAGLVDDTVYSIAGGAKNEVWVARKYGGATRLLVKNDSLQAFTYTRRDGLAQDAVASVYRAADERVWAGTLDEGVSRFDGVKWRTFTARDGLPSDRISVITGDSAGSIFLGTPNGLAMFKNNHWLAYTARDGLPPGAVQSLFLDQGNTLWIGTSKGISFLQSGAIHVPIGAPNALYGEILGIAESNGWLWITTRDHVLRVRSAALLKQSFNEQDYREFGVSEGLPSAEGVKRSPSLVEDGRGQLWFSLNGGISVLEPPGFTAPAIPVTTRVDGIVVDGRFVASADEIRIPPGRHRLTFRYAGVNVSNPEGVRYRYRLDTVDSDWSEPTALREIGYTNVPPGQLRFHVVARDPDGVWSTQETTTSLRVEPEYWQSRWFQVVSVAALLLLVLGLYRVRLQQLHHQFNVGLEARVNERTRIARELHDTLLQSFHGLLFQFQAARNMLPRRPEEAIQVLDGALGATEQAITESRGAIQDLRSELLAQRDLEELLTAMGHELTDVQNANHDSPVIRVIVEGERQALAPVLQNEIGRIARELLRNAFRHAQAHRIEAEVRYDSQALRLRIRDDGKGLDPKILEAGGSVGHWGLRGVRERAQQIGAHLDFWSEAGAGTEVQLAIPASIAYKTSQDGSRFNLFRFVKRYVKRP